MIQILLGMIMMCLVFHQRWITMMNIEDLFLLFQCIQKIPNFSPHSCHIFFMIVINDK